MAFIIESFLSPFSLLFIHPSPAMVLDLIMLQLSQINWISMPVSKLDRGLLIVESSSSHAVEAGW